MIQRGLGLLGEMTPLVWTIPTTVYSLKHCLVFKNLLKSTQKKISPDVSKEFKIGMWCICNTNQSQVLQQKQSNSYTIKRQILYFHFYHVKTKHSIKSFNVCKLPSFRWSWHLGQMTQSLLYSTARNHLIKNTKLANKKGRNAQLIGPALVIKKWK